MVTYSFHFVIVSDDYVENTFLLGMDHPPLVKRLVFTSYRSAY